MLILIGGDIHKIIHLLKQLKAVKETMQYTIIDKYNYLLEIFHKANRKTLHV